MNDINNAIKNLEQLSVNHQTTNVVANTQTRMKRNVKTIIATQKQSLPMIRMVAFGTEAVVFFYKIENGHGITM